MISNHSVWNSVRNVISKTPENLFIGVDPYDGIPYFINTSHTSRLLVYGSGRFIRRLVSRSLDLVRHLSNYIPLFNVFHVGEQAVSGVMYYRFLTPNHARETCEFVCEFTQSPNFWGIVLVLEDLSWAGDYLDTLLNAHGDSRITLIGAFDDENLRTRLGNIAGVVCGSRIVFEQFEIETGLQGGEDEKANCSMVNPGDIDYFSRSILLDAG